MKSRWNISIFGLTILLLSACNTANNDNNEDQFEINVTPVDPDDSEGLIQPYDDERMPFDQTDRND